jgi:hypothetical protein
MSANFNRSKIMMAIITTPENPGLEPDQTPVATVERRLLGTVNGLTGAWTTADEPKNVSESPLAPDEASNTAVPCAQSAAPALVPASENPAPPEKKSRSYTRRAEIAGKCVLVTLHPDRIELRAKYGRQRAEWAFEKLWDAAEGKLL